MDNLFDIPNEWQFVDPTNGYLFPWYTLPLLEEISKWDISQFEVFESGGGASTVWWASKCKHVTVLEATGSWIEKIKSFAEIHHLNNISYNLVDSLEVDFEFKYISVLSRQTKKFDVIISDGNFRSRICIEALAHLKDCGYIILENFNQSEIWVPIGCFSKLLKFLPLCIYKQPPMQNPIAHPFYCDLDGKRDPVNLMRGHPDWQTAYWHCV